MKTIIAKNEKSNTSFTDSVSPPSFSKILYKKIIILQCTLLSTTESNVQTPEVLGMYKELQKMHFS